MREIAKQSKATLTAILITLAISACGHIDEHFLETTKSVDSKESTQQAPITISNKIDNPGDMGRGDILFLDLSEGAKEVDFDGVSQNAEFKLIVGTAATFGSSHRMQLANSVSELDVSALSSVSEEVEAGSTGAEAQLHKSFREIEIELSLTHKEASFSLAKATSFNVSSQSGDKKEFRVLGNINSMKTYVTVETSVECVGQNVLFYVDQEVSESDLSKEDVDKLCNQFDTIAQKEQVMFGNVSDVNGDGRVSVVMTPQVNRLGEMGGGIITGFFNASDLYPRSSSNLISNEEEVLFVLVPDPDGRYGTPVSKEFALGNLLPTVLPHELQHAISYNQHVLENEGQPEERWLNEGLSHLAEDLMGLNQENFSRYGIYLRSLGNAPLVTSASPGLATRGGSYLFLRYLYEQADSGARFISNLLNTNLTGIENVEAAFDGVEEDFDQFSEFFLRWSIALALTDQGVTSDSRYIYQERVLDSQTGEWTGVCMICKADDSRGTVLQGPNELTYFGYHAPQLSPTSAKIYDIDEVPGQVALGGSDDGLSFGVLIRVK